MRPNRSSIHQATLLLSLCSMCTSALAQGIPQPRHVGSTSDCAYSTIQAAINAALPGEEILIQGGHVYNERLVISNKSLDFGTALCTPIIGRPGEAPAPDLPARISISGSGGANAPVFTISGSSTVSLQNLNITDGHASNGAGIYYNGTGSLTLSNVVVMSNTANAGAGIDFNGSGGNATLNLGDDVIISNNTAHGSGGGIRLRGSSHLQMDGSAVLLLNHADAEGGGIQVVSPASADIGSPGNSGVAAIYLNEATNGGGMAIYYSSGAVPIVRFYTTDANQPVTVQGNSASNVGGGFYIHSDNDTLRYHTLAFFEARVNENIARNGAAIFQDDYDYFGPGVFATSMVTMGDAYTNTPRPPQAVHCAAGMPCREISGNSTLDINGQPVPGAIVYVSSGGVFEGNLIRMQNNSGAQLFFEDSDDDVTQTSLQTSLITDNTMTDTMFRKNKDASLYLHQSTLSHNTIGGASVAVGDVGYFTLTNSIVDQPGKTVYTGGGNRSAEYVLTQDLGIDAYGTSIFHGGPIFQNAPAGDYHLSVTKQGATVFASAGVDVQPPVTGDDRDLDNRPFDQDVGAVPNGAGVRDLGALEAQPIVRIFADGFGDAIRMVD